MVSFGRVGMFDEILGDDVWVFTLQVGIWCLLTITKVKFETRKSFYTRMRNNVFFHHVFGRKITTCSSHLFWPKQNHSPKFYTTCFTTMKFTKPLSDLRKFNFHKLDLSTRKNRSRVLPFLRLKNKDDSSGFPTEAFIGHFRILEILWLIWKPGKDRNPADWH